MACGGCTKRREATVTARSLLNNSGSSPGSKDQTDVVMGGYKYLTDRQIKARLETYKRRYCSGCDKRYDCTYETYFNCKVAVK